MGGEKIRLIEGVIGERLSQVGKVEEDAGIIRDKEFGFQQELLDILCVCSLDFYAGMDAGKASGKALHFRMKLDEQRIVILLQQFSHLPRQQQTRRSPADKNGINPFMPIPQGFVFQRKQIRRQVLLPAAIGNKVTIGTFFFAKWNMNIKSCHINQA